jgi:hypothetical protein
MYENRMVCFVDILGFGALVEMSSQSEVLQAEIYEFLTSFSSDKALEEIHHGVAGYNQIDKPEINDPEFFEELKELNHFNITHFSDSIVISTAIDKNGLSWCCLLDHLARFQIRLFHKFNLLVRGGVTYGQIAHDDKGILFGPALNRAYYLESKLAVYPRIIIDKIIYNQLINAEFGYMLSPLVSDSEEGLLNINLATAFEYLYSGCGDSIFGSRDYGFLSEYFYHAKESINSNLAHNLPEHIRLKHKWLSTQMKKVAL